MVPGEGEQGTQALRDPEMVGRWKNLTTWPGSACLHFLPESPFLLMLPERSRWHPATQALWLVLHVGLSLSRLIYENVDL